VPTIEAEALQRSENGYSLATKDAQFASLDGHLLIQPGTFHQHSRSKLPADRAEGSR
jgi:hypothetical protein